MKIKYISKKENILGGAPVISGTRIPAERLTRLIEMGYTEENIKKEFPRLEIRKIRGAIFELASEGLRKISA